MDDYKKNIFFFWDKDTPKVYVDHVADMQKRWSTYNVHLITDVFMSEYYREHDSSFEPIYNRISLGTCKSDLVRLLLMYQYGGLWLDIMNYPTDSFTDMDVLFSQLEKKTTYVGASIKRNSGVNGIGFQMILSKPKSDLMHELYNLCKKNLCEQYTIECVNNERKTYNLITLTGPILFHDIVVQKTFSSWDKYLTLEENSIKNKQYFDKWDCELIDRDKYFWCWRVGFDNHHGINMDKHWSKRQLIQNLFI
jgi:mannosyltransferase OCH1-like enzyme